MNLEAPVGYTCTTIDNIKTDIAGVLSILEECDEDLSISKIFEKIGEVSYTLQQLSGRHSELEDVRSANSELRDWGYNLVAHIADLENEIEELQNNQES
jgi:hypothetical protein